MSLFLAIIWLVVGAGLILWGADRLTDGSAAIARRLGVSDLVVGLTVIAFGTSTPELAISLMSALKGSSAMAIGNVVGSNIFNVLAIIGITAMLRPIHVGRSLMLNEIPLVFLSAVALLAIGLQPEVSRTDGILLLLFFAIFMRYVLAQAKSGDGPDAAPAMAEEAKAENKKEMKAWAAVAWVIVGLACLVFGGDRFVAGASAIASAMGVSDAIIGLTIVAVGTSLPELAASIAAALKGHPDMALGNVIGSNIFNIFMVLGLTATVCPLPFGGITMLDLWVLTGACGLFWLFGRIIGRHTITRLEGTLMLACYVAYTILLILRA